MEGLLGRLAGGALWGLGAGFILSVLGGHREEAAAVDEGGRPAAGLRPAARSAMRAYVAVADRVRETAAEAREGLDDLYAEAKAERGGAPPATPEALHEVDRVVDATRPTAAERATAGSATGPRRRRTTA